VGLFRVSCKLADGPPASYALAGGFYDPVVSIGSGKLAYPRHARPYQGYLRMSGVPLCRSRDDTPELGAIDLGTC
jgi:hypothetical protein